MAFLLLLTCLSVMLQGGQGAVIRGEPKRNAGFLNIEEMMLHPSASPFAVSGNSTESAGTSLASVLNSLEHQVQYELHFGAQVERKSKIVLAAIVGAHLGLCGVDRCFFGQLGLGLVKFLTGGGCCIWYIIDTIALIINFCTFSSSIDSLYMVAEFRPSTCHAAFWVWLAMWVTQQIIFYKSSGYSESQAFARRKLGDEMVGPPSEQEIKALFKKFDKDGNGTLDYSELDDALRYLGIPDTKLELYKTCIDCNSDQKVDIQEFATACGLKKSMLSVSTDALPVPAQA